MSRFLYPIRRLKVMPWIKYWLIKRTAGTLSEILENLTSPITLNNSLRRKFHIFEIEGNSVQDGTPTPESPVSIRNVGDNVNLLNDSLRYFVFGGNIYFGANNATSTFLLKAGTYTFSVDVNCKLDILKEGGTISQTNTKSLTFTLSEDTQIRARAQSATFVNANSVGYAKIEEGSTPTGYAPYNCGSVDVKVENKNLYNDELEVGSIDNNGNNSYNTVQSRNKNYILLKSNTEYTISTNIQCNIGLRFYDKNKTYLSNMTSTPSPRTFTMPENAYYLRIVITINDLTNKVQIEQGSTATSYVPHEEQTVTFPTKEGQVIHLGDTLEDDGVHQRRFTKVFDGSETFEQFQAWGNYYRARFSMLNAKTFSTNDDNGQLCSHFIYSKSGSLGTEAQANKGSFAQYHDSDKFYFVFEQTSITAFKAFLAEQYANGTPVTLEYELAEPIIVPYNEAQQKAYDKIKALYSYKGTTHISSDNEPSPIFKIQYVKEE